MEKRSLRNRVIMSTILTMACMLNILEVRAEEIYKASPSNALFISVQNEDNTMATGKNITVKNEEGTVIGTWTVGNKPECRDIYQWCFDRGTFKMKEEYFVRAYKMVDGKKVYLCKSPTTHVAMSYHKCTNVKSLKTAKKSYDLTVNQTVKLKTQIKKQNKKLKIIDHEPKLRYFTSCKDVAVVDKKGKVTAVGQGKCNSNCI